MPNAAASIVKTGAARQLLLSGLAEPEPGCGAACRDTPPATEAYSASDAAASHVCKRPGAAPAAEEAATACTTRAAPTAPPPLPAAGSGPVTLDSLLPLLTSQHQHQPLASLHPAERATSSTSDALLELLNAYQRQGDEFFASDLNNVVLCTTYM